LPSTFEAWAGVVVEPVASLAVVPVLLPLSVTGALFFGVSLAQAAASRAMPRYTAMFFIWRISFCIES